MKRRCRSRWASPPRGESKSWSWDWLNRREAGDQFVREKALRHAGVPGFRDKMCDQPAFLLRRERQIQDRVRQIIGWIDHVERISSDAVVFIVGFQWSRAAL